MLVGEREEPRADFALVPMGPDAELAATSLASELRRAGHTIELAYRGNMKKRMKRADDSGAGYAIIIGDDELAENEATVKNLHSGEQQRVALSRLVEHFRK